MEWDEYEMISTFLDKYEEKWRNHVEENGFQVQLANSIRVRFKQMTLGEQMEYVRRFGPEKPSFASCTMQVTKGDQVLDIRCEFNWHDRWYVAAVPSKVAFVLLASDLKGAQERLSKNGWAYDFVGADRTPNNFPEILF